MTDLLLDLNVLERHVARSHPDPQSNRQVQAEVHDSIVSAGWLVELLHVEQCDIVRWRLNGITYFEADRLCTGLGAHPSQFWTDWWSFEPTDSPQFEFDLEPV
jgi:hypothetical protein